MKKRQEFKQRLAANKGKTVPVEEKLFITIQVKDIIASVNTGKIKVNPLEVKEIVSDVVSRWSYKAGETIKISKYYDCCYDLLVEKNNQFKIV